MLYLEKYNDDFMLYTATMVEVSNCFYDWGVNDENIHKGGMKYINSMLLILMFRTKKSYVNIT